MSWFKTALESTVKRIDKALDIDEEPAAIGVGEPAAETLGKRGRLRCAWLWERVRVCVCV